MSHARLVRNILPSCCRSPALALHAASGPNQWPDEALVPGFRGATTELFAALALLSASLVEALALCLGLPATAFDTLFLTDTAERAHMQASVNLYPAGAPAGEFGLGPHSDSGFLTLVLQQPDHNGLEALLEPKGSAADTEADRWLRVRIRRAGSVGVNLGEMLQLLTAGRMLATVHRVIPPPAPEDGGVDRVSVTYFHNPRLSAVVSPDALAPDVRAALLSASTDGEAESGATSRSAVFYAGENPLLAECASSVTLLNCPRSAD